LKEIGIDKKLPREINYHTTKANLMNKYMTYQLKRLRNAKNDPLLGKY